MPPDSQAKNFIHLDIAAAALIFALFILYSVIGCFGYGNDCDTYLMLVSGRKLLLEGIYQYSRPPGYLIPEIVIGGVSLIGGHVLTNLISASLGAASLYLFWRLLSQRFSSAISLWMTAIVGVNPHFMIAASSSMDYVYSLFFGLLGTTALSAKKPFFASLLFALAVSSRLSNVLLIAIIYAYFLYVLYMKSEHRDMTRVFLSGVLTVCLSVAVFVPSYIAAGRTLGFLTYVIGDWNFFGHLVRLAYKNIYLVGLVPFLLLGGVAVRNVATNKAAFSLSPEIIAGLAIVFVGELLFFKVPLEIAYLLPLLFVAIPLFVLIFAPQKTALCMILVFTALYGFVFNPEIFHFRYTHAGSEKIGADVGLFLPHGVVVADVLAREYSQNKYFKHYNIPAEN